MRIPVTLRIFLWRAIPVVLLIAAGFLIYSQTISSRRSYVIQRNFRLLDTMRQQMGDRIANLRTVVKQGDRRSLSRKNAVAALTCVEKGSTQAAEMRTAELRLRESDGCYADVSSMLGPYMSFEAFDGFLFASAAGEVIYQNTAAGLRVVNLKRAVEDGLREADAAERAKAGAPAEDFDTATKTSRLVTVRLAGTQYNLFLQPAQFDGIEGRWLLGGLVRANHPAFENIESVPGAVPLIFLLAIVAASLPLHKLWMMRAAERLRSSDRLWFAASTAVTFSLLAVFLADLSMRADPGRDRSLKDFANQVAGNFYAEIRKAYLELQFLEGPACFDPQTARGGDPYRRCKTDPSSREYPYFDSVFWMDAAGKQQIRRRTDGLDPELGSRSERAYFQNVIRRKFWRLCLDPRTGCTAQDLQKFTLEPLMSWTTGEYLAVVGAPSKKATKDGKELPAAAIAIRLPAAIRPVVRPGFGFAIVEDDGTVRFLSSWASHPDRNVFTECARGERLRALVKSHQTGYLSTDVHSRPHRLYVRPLGDENLIIPWSLVTYEDRSRVLAMHLRVLLRVGAYSLIYFAALGVFAMIAWKLRVERPWRLIWRAEPLDYVYLIVLYAVCGGLVWRGVLWWGEWQAPAAAGVAMYALAVSPLRLGNGRPGWPGGGGLRRADLGIPAGVAALSWLAGDGTGQILTSTTILVLVGIVLSLPPLKDRLPFKAIWSRNAQTAAAAALAIALGILPALGFYRAAFEGEAEVGVREAQAFLARALNERRERVEGMLGRVQMASKEQLIQNRLQLSYGDVYPLLDGFVSGGPAPAHGSGAECRMEGDWRACREGGRLFLEYVNEDRWERMAANAPLLQLERQRRFWIWAGVLASALAGWMGFLVRRMAVVDLGKTLEYRPFEIPPRIGENVLVLIQPGAEPARQLEDIEGVYAIDLAQLESPGAWLKVITDVFRYCSVVAVEHFEFNIAASDWTAAKLELLEHLIFVLGKTVVVFSAVDPEFYLRHGGAGQGQPQPAASIARWQAVLDRFSRRERRESEDPNFAEAALGLSRKWAPGMDAEESARVITEECGRDARLQSLCREMLAADPPVNARSAKELLEAIGARLRPYYTALWDACSKREKLVVVQVAEDGLLNPKSVEVARELKRKRLIETAPLRLMNETFRRFVIHQLTAEQIHTWEQEGERRGWRKIGIVAAGVVAMGILALVIGQDSDLVRLVTVVVTFATSLLGLGAKWLARGQEPRGQDGATNG